MQSPRVQVLLDDADLTPEVKDALHQVQADVQLLNFEGLPPFPLNDRPSDARLVLTRDGRSLTNGKLHRFLHWYDQAPCATLVLSGTAFDPGHRPEDAVSNRPIRFETNLTREHLTGRLLAMCDLTASLDALQRDLDMLRQRDQALSSILRRLQAEVRLAGLIQRNLTRAPLPAVHGATINILDRPASEVCGDAYQVTRLDESHVAITVADATGHGLSAGLLSVFIQRCLASQKHDSLFRLLPDAVLAHLNHEILEARIEECHFVSAVYAVYHEPTRLLHYARAGAPHPLILNKNRPLQALTAKGTLLGVTPHLVCEPVSVQLQPGDTIVLYTDGLDQLASPPDNEPSLIADAKNWFMQRQSQSWSVVLQELERMPHRTNLDKDLDDVTLVSLTVD